MSEESNVVKAFQASRPDQAYEECMHIFKRENMKHKTLLGPLNLAILSQDMNGFTFSFFHGNKEEIIGMLEEIVGQLKSPDIKYHYKEDLGKR